MPHAARWGHRRVTSSAAVFCRRLSGSRLSVAMKKCPYMAKFVVLAGGQLKVPIPRSSCRPGIEAWAATVAVSASHHHRPGSFH